MSTPQDKFTQAARLNRFLLASIGRKPGEIMDETDEKIYQRTLRPLYEGIRDGNLTADFEKTAEGSDVPSGACSSEVWAIIFFIRNGEFRPSMEALEKKVHEVMKITRRSPSEAANVVEAPKDYLHRSGQAVALGSVVAGLLPGSGKEPIIDPAAEWVKRFACELATGDEDKDRVLIRMLALCGNDNLRHLTIDKIVGEREASAMKRAEVSEGAGVKREGRAAEQGQLDLVMHEVYRMREQTQPQ